MSTHALAPPRIIASPLARKIAAGAGIDLGGIAGSGPGGRIVKADVEAAIAADPAKPKPISPPAVVAPLRAVASPAPVVAEPAGAVEMLARLGIAEGTYRLAPMDLMRKTIARRMTEAFRDIPHFPLTVDLEIDKLLAARAEINSRFADQGVKISVNDLLIKACALSLIRAPDANASFTPEGVAYHHHADIAVAVAIPGGLITPIIRAAETKGLAQISAEMADLAERARARKLKPEEFQGGTFSLSNLGMMGIKSFASILNPPQGMILSAGAGERRAVVKGEAIVPATIMTVTLTCDHRVVDGAIGAQFLKALRGFVEEPMSLML